jgi:serine protease inhibitor
MSLSNGNSRRARSSEARPAVCFSVVIVAVAAILIILSPKIARSEAARPLPSPPPDVKAVADANNRFALDLYARLKKGDENLFYSPYSISTALAMTYAGARGTTAEEMAKVLHFNLPVDRLHPACGGLVESLNEAGKKGDFQLSVANRLWGQKGEGFLKEFLGLTERYYHAGLSEVDFAGDTESVRKTINDWVEKQTAEKIKDLIKEGVLGRDTALVLTNAIYMKADWLSQFDKKLTKDELFFAPGHREIKAPTMHQKEEFGYVDAEGIQVLELLYKGDRLSMVVLLPRDKDGLAKLEARLSIDNLGQWLAQLSRQKVMVSLPKFKATRDYRLSEPLMSLGMNSAFGIADFSGMNGRRNLFISEVIHKAFVDVDEQGTEAAAATAVVISGGIARPTPEFRADHPFVFLIRDRQTGAILFMGRVTEPRSE